MTYNSYVNLRPPSRKREHQTLQKPLIVTPTPVASAEDRAATVSSDRGPEQGDPGAAPKGPKVHTETGVKMAL